jgi:hypothetical protein
MGWLDKRSGVDSQSLLTLAMNPTGSEHVNAGASSRKVSPQFREFEVRLYQGLWAKNALIGNWTGAVRLAPPVSDNAT